MELHLLKMTKALHIRALTGPLKVISFSPGFFPRIYLLSLIMKQKGTLLITRRPSDICRLLLRMKSSPCQVWGRMTSRILSCC
ncbi:hypothetical protein LINPERHAP2_LOCUS42457 [Linum perenne]